MATETVDKREMMANQLLMRGCATMLELLTASFGEWPPKGLDVNPDVLHDQKVDIKTFVKKKKYGERGMRANATMEGERIIQIRDDVLKDHGLIGTLGHEALHILQGDHSTRLEGETLKTSHPLPLALEAEKESQAKERGKSFAGKLIGGLFGGKVKAQESKVAQEYTKETASARIMEEITSDVRHTLRTSRNTIASEFNYLSYIKLGWETQVRIHEVIIDGYSTWGKVPATQDEFLAAMKNAGFKMPEAVEKHLEQLPGNSSARQFLKAIKNGSWTDAVGDLQKVSDSLMPDIKDRPDIKDYRTIFWTKTMPALYADLIEMYGDKPGRERFGLGVNPKALNPAKIVQNPTPTKSQMEQKKNPSLS